jgi:Kef-type K+ transport system membrane component KefB
MAKSLTKAIAVYPAVRAHRYEGNSGAYYTLMMSTGLTFGTISALFGLNHKIIDQAQYSYMVGTVIASAVIPTMIANSFFLPRHLLPHAPRAHNRNSCAAYSRCRRGIGQSPWEARFLSDFKGYWWHSTRLRMRSTL